MLLMTLVVISVSRDAMSGRQHGTRRKQRAKPRRNDLQTRNDTRSSRDAVEHSQDSRIVSLMVGNPGDICSAPLEDRGGQNPRPLSPRRKNCLVAVILSLVRYNATQDRGRSISA